MIPNLDEVLRDYHSGSEFILGLKELLQTPVDQMKVSDISRRHNSQSVGYSVWDAVGLFQAPPTVHFVLELHFLNVKHRKEIVIFIVGLENGSPQWQGQSN